MGRNIFRAMQVITILVLCASVGCSASRRTITATPDHRPQAITVTNQEGFPLTLRSVFQEGDNIKAVFCFQLPTEDDWQLGTKAMDVIISAGSLSSVHSGGGIADAGSGQGSKRCIYTLFTAPDWQSVSKVKLTVSKIATSMPEVPDCEKAQEKLNRKLIPITIACQPGDHSFHWEVSKKPATISMEKAREIAYDEGLVDMITGPWTFESDFFAANAE